MTTSVLLLTRYPPLGASSRYRFYQYVPYLEGHGYNVTAAPLLDEEYLRRIYSRRRPSPWSLLRGYLARLGHLLQARRYDLVWLEYEALPWVPGFVESLLHRLAGVPYVVDYDDARFHQYDAHRSRLVRATLGHKIDRVMREAAVVTAGNEYLADRARQAGARRVEVVPTVVDLERYPCAPAATNDVFTVGWIGTPFTAVCLQRIQPALAEFCRLEKARVLAIGSGPLDWPDVPVEVVPWSEATEIAALGRCDVGIMPLADNLWERGKCGFKLIQYMACGLPVVGSPVGVNRELIRTGYNGFAAETQGEWVEALRTLKRDTALRSTMGRAGRELVAERYCLQVTAPILAELLHGALKAGGVREGKKCLLCEVHRG